MYIILTEIIVPTIIRASCQAERGESVKKTKQNRLSDLEMNTVLTAVEREQSAGEANS